MEDYVLSNSAFEGQDKEKAVFEPIALPVCASESLAVEANNEAVKKKPRSLGLKAVDFVLYPVLTNFVVFAVSVASGYITNIKKIEDVPNNPFAKWLHGRGQKFEDFVMKHGLTKDQSDSAKMVTFSFLDGSIMAPFIKLFEDRREKIARYIDKLAGTTPQDDAVYAEEPKQSWASVLGGRVAALAVVLPVAVTLDKLGHKNNQWGFNKNKNDKEFSSINKMMFNDLGVKIGEDIEKSPEIVKYFGGIKDIPKLMSVSVFEAVYTSLCTVTLYFSSRFFAGFGAKKSLEHQPVNLAMPAEKPHDFSGEEKVEKKKFVDVVQNNKNNEQVFSY